MLCPCWEISTWNLATKETKQPSKQAATLWPFSKWLAYFQLPLSYSHLIRCDAVGDGLLHALPGDLSHHQIGETIQHLWEEGNEGDLQLRVWKKVARWWRGDGREKKDHIFISKIVGMQVQASLERAPFKQKAISLSPEWLCLHAFSSLYCQDTLNSLQGTLAFNLMK